MNDRVFCVDTGKYINQGSIKDYKITGDTQKIGTMRCAVLKKENDNNTYLKPWDSLVFLRKNGEKNINAKLTTSQVREIVVLAYTKKKEELSIKDLSEKFNVSPKTIISIISGKAWCHVTLGLIAQLKTGYKEVLDSCVSATNDTTKKSTKLNPSMAKFIVRDSLINKIPTKKLAIKYLMSESAIRKILTGKAWAKVTVPAIEEFSKWNR